MGFQTPITIKKALDRIHDHEYVLPAIQREFVWTPNQICRLFDSLMLGYPIGSFLLWKVTPASSRQYKFYGFVRNYHERDDPHCPDLDIPPDRAVTAVLDGQQRLTAINIGLRGSYAKKAPGKWRTNPNAFPEKRLHLNLLADAEENDEGMRYDFDFLSEDDARERDGTHFWFPVADVLDLDSGADLFDVVHEAKLADNKLSFRRLERLHTLVHKDGVISYFEEEEQDLDKVLNIFIRTNSGGTVLSYSDLLLSTAVAQWEELDARKEIHGLVDDLCDVGEGFDFSQDFVLKAGLMLIEIQNVGFKVTNFNRNNMLLLESKWKQVSNALRVTVELVSGFGFSSQTLSAHSALLPIAYYVYKRRLSEAFLTSTKNQRDRAGIRDWLIRSLLKSGVWGSGLDTLLTALRSTIAEHGDEVFPVDRIDAAMARRGRPLRFEDVEIQDLADVSYRDPKAFTVLALLFPFVDLRNRFHVDHIFPQSRFTNAKLLKEGVDASRIDEFVEWSTRLGNLQLLEGSHNEGKRAKLPHAWIAERFPSPQESADYTSRHDLGRVPASIAQFESFYEARRKRMVERLKALLSPKQ